MRARYWFAIGLVIPLLMAATGSGFPSRPRFQTVTVAGVASAGTLIGGSAQINHAGDPRLSWNNTNDAVNWRLWDVFSTGGNWCLRAVADNQSSAANAICASRNAVDITDVSLGDGTGTVKANGVAIPKTAYAQIINNGSTCTIDSAVANQGITSPSRGGTGNCGLVFSPAFTTRPVCTTSTIGAPGQAWALASSTTVGAVGTNNSAGTPTDLTAQLICVGT